VIAALGTISQVGTPAISCTTCKTFRPSYTAENKKADVAEHPKAFGHVGLLFNQPLGKAELLFIQSSDCSMDNYTARTGKCNGPWLNTLPSIGCTVYFRKNPW
jgi:hypothetical protein